MRGSCFVTAIVMSFFQKRAEAVYNFGNRTSGAVVHFEFPRTECLAGSFVDSIGTSLFGDLVPSAATQCNDGLGVSLRGYATAGAAQVVSSADATNFLAAMAGKRSFSLEFWKASAPNNDPTASALPIVTLGAVGDAVANDCEVSYTHTTYSLTAFESEYDALSPPSGGRVDFR